MTNREKWADKLIDFALHYGRVGLKPDGSPAPCHEFQGCVGCGRHKGWKCAPLMDWANAEYIELPVDWSKVAVDTPILVRNSAKEKWDKRYFAKYEDGKIYTWVNGKTSWSSVHEQFYGVWEYAKLAEDA